MTDTEAMFALWEDSTIVTFIKRHHKDNKFQYEVICACRVLGLNLIKKYKLLSIYRSLSKRAA